MERIRDLLARLTELTDDELAELGELILAETDARRQDGGRYSPEVAAELAEIADAQDARVAEVTRRDTEQAQVDEAAAAALARITASEEQDPPPGEHQPAHEVDPVNPAGDNPEPQHAVPPEETEEDEPQAVAAAARTRTQTRAPARRPTLAAMSARTRAAERPPEGPPPPEQPHMVATAGSSHYAPGHRFTSLAEVADAMVERLRGSGPGEGNVPIARAHYPFPEERQLRAGEDAGNSRKLRTLLDSLTPEAVTAAGGLCAPLPTIYDVDVLGSPRRPLRDGGLPTLGAERGGVQWRGTIAPSALAASVGTWTMQNDIDAGTVGAPDPVKPVIEIECPSSTSATVEALTQRIRFSNVTARFDPETVAANVLAGEIVYAQIAERDIIAKMDSKMITLTHAKALGAVRDVLVLLDKVRAYSLDRFRLETQGLRVGLPRWVQDLMRADLTRSLSPEELAAADAQIDAWFARRNMTPVWLFDGPAAQAAITGPPAIPAIVTQRYAAVANGDAVPGFPNQAIIRFWTEGDFALLDGGELDLGIVRDSALNAVNRYETFYEEFYQVIFRGVEALRVIATLQPTGEVAGTVSTSAFVD